MEHIRNLAHDQILLLGDSITQFAFSRENGFGSAIADHYQRKLDVICRGLSGYNTRWMKPLLPSILRTTLPPLARHRVITLFLGANDSTHPESPQHVPLREYVMNLHDMIATIRVCSPIAKVILISNPPINEPRFSRIWAERGCTKDRTFLNTLAYYRATRDQVGRPWEQRDPNVAFLDLYTALLGDANADRNLEGPALIAWAERVQRDILSVDVLPDGLHLGPAGNQRLGDALIKLIETKWGSEVGAEAVEPLINIPWSELEDPENSPP
ncbi:SGNH hydrolase-type esterase domain-containing protein [Cladochytrium replicatum]|nr:SGNH hydrolase-type esterase domain-containing protein [Cladochytrium replicatum]